MSKSGAFLKSEQKVNTTEHLFGHLKPMVFIELHRSVHCSLQKKEK